MKAKAPLTNKFQLKNLKGGVIPLLGISLIIFVLTVAVYFAANYVAESYSKDNMLSNWEYLYTEKAGAVPDGELRQLNAQTPILTERALRRGNLYLTRSIEPTDTGKTLVFNTDFSPAKIRINGKEVYNNHFSTAEFVGNCFNAIYLEPSTHSQNIEIFLKLPLSVRFEAYLNEGRNTVFHPNFALMLGAVLLTAGIVAAAVAAVLSIVRRRLHNSLYVAGIAAFAGLGIVLHLIPECTYLLNEPIWLRVFTTPVHLTFMATLACLNSLFRDHKKSNIAIAFASGISAVIVILSFTPLIVKFSVAAMCVLCLVAALYVAQHALRQLERRTQYAEPAFVICVYYAMAILLAGIFLLIRQRVLYIYTVALPTLVLAGVMEYIFVAEYRFNKKNRELHDEASVYGDSVDSISLFIRNMLGCSSAGFYETAVDEIISFLVKYRSENENVRCCAAIKEKDDFKEVVNRGVEGCNYSVIEKSYRHSGKNCLFSETYFDYILRDGDEIGAIIHAENISNGLDVFFVSMLEAVYCGLETTYENIFSQNNHRSVNIIFEELAENAELDNGCSVEHLQNISRFTRALCLRLGMDEEKAEHYAIAAKLHDLGKIAVPKYIINKEGRLSEEERVIVNSHTRFGYTILAAYSDDPLIADAAVIARYHHERYDGTGGYGLKGEEIPLPVRIVTICDVYDALTNERTYKSAWSKADAIDYLEDNKGKLFDPKITDSFIEYLNEAD